MDKKELLDIWTIPCSLLQGESMPRKKFGTGADLGDAFFVDYQFALW